MSQGAKDVGLPDRSGCSGWLTPGRVVEFWGWKTLLAPIRKPRYSTPLTSVMSSTTTMAVPMKNAIAMSTSSIAVVLNSLRLSLPVAVFGSSAT